MALTSMTRSIRSEPCVLSAPLPMAFVDGGSLSDQVLDNVRVGGSVLTIYLSLKAQRGPSFPGTLFNVGANTGLC